jgi:hypothetical protein
LWDAQQLRTIDFAVEEEIMSDRPQGSGYFAAACGFLLLISMVLAFRVDIHKIRPEIIVAGWMGFLGSILAVWGIRRILTGKRDWTVGQETIKFVLALVGSVFALIALLKGSQ